MAQTSESNPAPGSASFIASSGLGLICDPTCIRYNGRVKHVINVVTISLQNLSLSVMPLYGMDTCTRKQPQHNTSICEFPDVRLICFKTDDPAWVWHASDDNQQTTNELVDRHRQVSWFFSNRSQIRGDQQALTYVASRAYEINRQEGKQGRARQGRIESGYGGERMRGVSARESLSARRWDVQSSKRAQRNTFAEGICSFLA